MKKLVSLLLGMLFVAGAAVSCGGSEDGFEGILTRKYDYDLSEYIDLAEYKGLAADGSRYEVTDEMVDSRFSRPVPTTPV